MILRQIPNCLTLIRLFLIVPFLIYLSRQAYETAFYIFIAAGFTDGLDGWLARHFKWQSAFGTMIDPIADKLLVLASFLSLGLIGYLPWWLIILVILRDITLSFGALTLIIITKQRLIFEPSKISKLNTSFQLALVTICLFEMAYFAFPTLVLQILIILTTITTSISFVDYVWFWGSKACQMRSHH